jgi:UDP-3-O-[3-hydroxymyristoyl] glucosamine N-acyltransferase
MATVSDIAAMLNAPLGTAASPADARRAVTGVAPLEAASPTELSFLAGDAHLRHLKHTRAAAVIVDRRVKLPASPAPRVPLIIVDDAELATARVLQFFAPPIPRPAAGIDPDARIASSATVADSAAIGAKVVVGERTTIGARTVLHPGVVIGAEVAIGEDCELFPNVVIRERITIGNRVVIHAGSVLGTDGFGYRWDGSRHVKVPQIGTIAIEDEVEIGSCVCIDRAKMGVTRIGHGTKIDNLVQIAHNCVIGPHCIIVGQAGLAGSVTLGTGVVLGGQSGVRDHVTVGDGAMAAARTAVHEDVDPRAIVSGMPALPHRQSLREQAAMRRLPDLVTQVRELKEEVEKLKKSQAGR